MELPCLPGLMRTSGDSINEPTQGKSFSMEAQKKYSFIVAGEENLKARNITIIDQKRGYSNAIYLLSVFLSLFLILTFATTKERVQPPKDQETNLGKDLKDLIRNKPWIILLVIGMLFNVYNSMKQGIVVIYFTHYLHNQLLAASYMVALMLASIAGAMITSPLGKRYGKRNLFIACTDFLGPCKFIVCFLRPGNINSYFHNRYHFRVWSCHIPDPVLCHAWRCCRLFRI